MKLNERAWAGQIISWIKQSINDGTTLFEEATNDEGIKLASGKRNFPMFFYLLIKFQVLFSMVGN